MEKQLTLPEKIYLLGIHPIKGGIIDVAASPMNFAVTGAVILELIQAGNIGLEGKKFFVTNKDAVHRAYRFVLDRIKNPSKPQNLSHVISRISFHSRELKEIIRQELEEKGIIRLSPKRFLYFFRWKEPVVIRKTVLYDIVEEVQRQTFGNPDEDSSLLLSLIIPANLLKRIFPEKERRKQARERLKKITSANSVAKAVHEAVMIAQSRAAAIVVT